MKKEAENNPNVKITQELRRKIIDIGENLRQKHSDPKPDILYHYTKYDGLMGILSGTTWRATHYKKLDDNNEMVYGDNKIIEYIRNRSKDTNIDERLKLTYERINKFLGNDITISSPFGNYYVYVACFADAGGLDYLWEHYADNKTGYCLGVKRRLTMDDSIRFERIEYDPNRQTQLFTELVNKAEQAIINVMPPNMTKNQSNIFPGSAARVLGMELFHLAFLFKLSSFHQEQEWRAIKVLWKVKKPFINLDFSSKNRQDLLPLESITLGSGLDTSYEVELKKTLRKYKYTGRYKPDVSISKI